VLLNAGVEIMMKEIINNENSFKANLLATDSHRKYIPHPRLFKNRTKELNYFLQKMFGEKLT